MTFLLFLSVFYVNAHFKLNPSEATIMDIYADDFHSNVTRINFFETITNYQPFSLSFI